MVGGVVVGIEEVFFRDDEGGVWSPSGFSDEFWQRYLSVFGKVDVIARLKYDSPPVGASRVPPELRFIPLPAYSGLLGMILSLPILVLSAFRAPRGCRYIFRSPGAISLVFGFVFIVRRMRYAIELVGDIDDVIRSIFSSFSGRAMAKAALLMTKFVVGNADGVAYVTRSVLQAKYPSGKHAVSASYSSVLIDEVASKKRSHSSFETVRLYMAGTFSQNYKGFDVAISAIKLLAEQSVEAQLTISGDGNLLPDCVELAKRLKVSDRVSFTGRVSRAEVLINMDLADVYLSCSRTEGLPRVIVEAMSRGLPVISTPVGGCKELVLPSYQFPVNDAEELAERIKRLVSSLEEYEGASIHSLSVAKQFLRDNVEESRRGFLMKL